MGTCEDFPCVVTVCKTCQVYARTEARPGPRLHRSFPPLLRRFCPRSYTTHLLADLPIQNGVDARTLEPRPHSACTDSQYTNAPFGKSMPAPARCCRAELQILLLPTTCSAQRHARVPSLYARTQPALSASKRRSVGAPRALFLHILQSPPITPHRCAGSGAMKHP